MRRPWASVQPLIPLCEDITKLSAVCRSCNANRAAFSWRLSSEQSQFLIGGATAYTAVCRNCYTKLQTKKVWFIFHVDQSVHVFVHSKNNYLEL